ncbi:MAG: alpha/beta hydrolase family protein [Thermoguttaceae bacterium]
MTVLLRPARLLLVALASWLAPAGVLGWQGQPEAAAGQFPQLVRVSKTFDGRPFDYRIESRADKGGYVVYRLSYPSPVVSPVPQNNTVPAEYYVPGGLGPGEPKRPAVICMHILDGNMELVRMQCTVLATHGIPAILFKLPYYGERGLREGPQAMAANPNLLVEAIAQGLEDMRRTIDLLASRPEVDPERIGIAGISLGGIVAATAAGREPRLARAMLILAGGDLLTIIHHARETEALSRVLKSLAPEQRAKIEAAIRAVDPLRHAPALRPRAAEGKVLMVNAAEDEVIPRACTERLASALGIGDRVEWLEGLGHYTAMAALPQVIQRMVGFFGEDLPAGVKGPPAGSPATPAQIVLGLLQQAVGFLAAEPSEGRCHFAELNVAVRPASAEPYEGRVLVIRGTQGRFKLHCRLPGIGDLAIGQGAYPWMASARKTLFRGVAGGQTGPRDPLAFAEPAHLLRIRVLAGALAGALLAPDILEPLASVREEPAAEGRRAIRVDLKQGSRIGLGLLLKEDGKTPEQLSFEAPGVKGSVRFTGWQINTVAHEAMFDPPAGLKPQDVPAVQLRRIFSAMFNFAMEKTQ